MAARKAAKKDTSIADKNESQRQSFYQEIKKHGRPDMPSSMEKLLPPAEQDLTQMEVIFALNGIFWGRLGSSELIPFLDKGDRSVLEEFQNKLLPKS